MFSRERSAIYGTEDGVPLGHTCAPVFRIVF